MTLSEYVIHKANRYEERKKASTLPKLQKVRRFTGIVCNAVPKYEANVGREASLAEICQAIHDLIHHHES